MAEPTWEERPLFPAPPTIGTARHVDPSTSRDAARSLDPTTMHRELRRVLATMRQLADAGERVTAGAVTDVLGDRQRNCVARRITDLRKGGLVRDSGQTWRDETVKGSRAETVWQVVDDA